MGIIEEMLEILNTKWNISDLLMQQKSIEKYVDIVQMDYWRRYIE